MSAFLLISEASRNASGKAVSELREKTFCNRKIRKTLAICAVLALLLGACSGLPRSGEVVLVERTTTASGGVALNAQGPAQDATAEEIVQGFLLAAAVGISDDFSTAREFLTESAAANWKPLTNVRIYPDNQTINSSQTITGAFRYVVPALATVNQSGSYALSAQDSTISGEFSLMRNAQGQWRIASLDDGITLSNALFESMFVQTPLYFYTPNNKYLVSDMRWYPRTGIFHRAVQGIFQGPATWLNTAVHSPIPEGTKVQSVELRAADSVVQIDLSSEASQLSASEVALLETQLLRTLTGIGGTQEVELSVDGAVLVSEGWIDAPVYPISSAPLTVLKNGLPTVLQEGKETQLLNEMEVGDTGLRYMATSYNSDRNFGAALNLAGTELRYLDFADNRVWPIMTGTSLIPPTIDIYGWIWSGESVGAGELQIYNLAEKETVKLKLPEFAGVRIKQVKVSREGARAVIVYEDSERTIMAVVAIVRDGQGRPTALGSPWEIGRRLAAVADYAWMSESRLVILGKTTAGSEDGLYYLDLGGALQSVIGIDDMIDVTAGRGRDSVVLLDVMGNIYEVNSGVWRRFASGVESVAFPG